MPGGKIIYTSRESGLTDIWSMDQDGKDQKQLTAHAETNMNPWATPDGRYIFTEPLYVLDVREWKQYALFEALQIPNYTNIEAISRDGKRLFISRRDCAMDCRGIGVEDEYFELILP